MKTLIFDKSCKSENERLVSHSWWRKKIMKAIGRLGYAIKLLQRQRRDSQCNSVSFVNGKAFRLFSKEPTGSKIHGYHPGNFFKSAVSQCHQKTVAPPPPPEKLRRVD